MLPRTHQQAAGLRQLSALHWTKPLQVSMATSWGRHFYRHTGAARTSLHADPGAYASGKAIEYACARFQRY